MGNAPAAWLDVGCSSQRQDGPFIGMDLRRRDVDVVGDARRLPFRDGAFEVIVMNHVFEHIQPEDTIGVMNEMHRAMVSGGELHVCVPYGVSGRYLQDPTHCNPCVPATFSYFDPRSPLWNVYQPKPWEIVELGRTPIGDIQVAMVKPSA